MMMSVSNFCFVLGSLTGLAGVSLGIFMGVTQDHSLTPVHAHLNLIGWVSMFLFGLYYHAHPEAEQRLAKVQAGAVAIGYLAMMGALASLILAPVAAALPIAIAGSVLVWIGMALFAVIVWRTIRAAAPRGQRQQTHATMSQ
jgi:cbb3-type cytochrome oxidase subunit 1